MRPVNSLVSWTDALLLLGDPRLMSVMRGFLDGLFRSWHQDGVKDLDRAISLSNTVSYADRLRIRHPGDAKFALGAHIDGGGVERWEDESFRNVWKAILEGRWQEYDAFRLGDNGEKLVAQGNMYEAPGGVSNGHLSRGSRAKLTAPCIPPVLSVSSLPRLACPERNWAERRHPACIAVAASGNGLHHSSPVLPSNCRRTAQSERTIFFRISIG